VSANGKLTTRHYLGWARNIRQRIEHHRAGTSDSKFMRNVNAAGVPWTTTHLWLGATRVDERRLKQQKKAWKLCPRCNAALRRGSLTQPTQAVLPF
jgi:predicted GIY-YIG superfamily endonuclease